MNIEKLPVRPPTSGGYRVDAAHPIIGVAIDLPGGIRVGAHAHPRAQLIYCVSGVVRVISDSGAWLVPTTQAAWIPPQLTHEVVAAQPLAIRTLFVEPDAAHGMPSDCCSVDVSPLLRALVLRAVEIGEHYPAEGAEMRLMQVLLDELRGLRIAPLHLPMARDPRVRHVIDGLLHDPADNRPLAAWSATAAASPRTLARLFVKQTGLSFGAWRQRLRVLEAIDRIGAGQGISQVAFDLGYHSASAFIAMFRRTVGVPPSRYLRGAN